MTEFKIYHLASQLISSLGTGETAGPEMYVDLLTRNMTRYVTTQVSTHNAKRKIAEFTTKHKEFLVKYDELKSKQIRELDALVYLMSRIIDQPSVLSMLQSVCPSSVPQSNTETTSLGELPQSVAGMVSSGAVMSQKELDELREQLATLTSSVEEVESKRGGDRQRRKTEIVGNVPDDPDWKTRVMLSSDFVVKSEASCPASVGIGSLPLELQETAIVEDMLFLLMGVEGKYIVARPLKHKFSRRHFVVDSSLDVSLHGVVHQLLPVCSYYSLVARFNDAMSGYHNGIVCHALTAAMRTLMKEELVLVAQLEKVHRLGELSLQRLWSHLQPVIRTMDVLATIIDSIVKSDCKGGQLLSLLHHTTTGFAGDVKTQELCLYLTQQACVPYFDILEQWIYKGIIRDAYNEFFVEEQKQLGDQGTGEQYHNIYWEERYNVCRDRIPVFLEKVADKILRTGKYLNVIRECGRDVRCPHAKEIVYTLHEREYVDQIEEAYSFASNQLLDLLMKENDLLGRLRSMKHYFLLDQGDFFVHFLDLADDELMKNIYDVSEHRVEALLELALRARLANFDPYIDDVRLELVPSDFMTQLTRILTVLEGADSTKGSFPLLDKPNAVISGIEALSLNYVVTWPVSLIINRKVLIKYQLLFRFLFYTKHIERQLNSLWLSDKPTMRRNATQRSWKPQALAVRQRMLNFVQNFQYYTMFEVVEPNWQIMEGTLRKVSTVDDVLDIHTDFLDRCLKDTMLTNTELLRMIHQLLTMCIIFSNRLKREDANRGMDEGASKDIEQILSKLDHEFTQRVSHLLKRLQLLSAQSNEHQMATMAARLDYNSFYNAKVELQPLVTVIQQSFGPVTGTSPLTHTLQTPTVYTSYRNPQSKEQEEAAKQTGSGVSAFEAVQPLNRTAVTQASQLEDKQTDMQRSKKTVTSQSERSVQRKLPTQPRDRTQRIQPK